MSMLKTGILLAALTALFMGAGWLLGGQGGMVIALIMAAGMNAFAYWNSDKMVLRMYGAREVDARSAPTLYGIVAQLADKAELPMPRVYIVDTDQPNAFATGRDPQHAAVCATSGILRILDSDELAGVLAHELGHVRHRDTLIMTVTATIAGAISMLASFAFWFRGSSRDNPLGPFGAILVMILGPIAAMLVQMAISRTREYAADREGAALCGHPLWLADALGKLEAGAAQIANAPAEQHPATAHLFIVNPLHGGGLASLFATHPPMEDRIRRLREMAGVAGPWG